MTVWWKALAARYTNPARELANIGHTQRRNKVKAVARQMRAELGLAPHKGLEA